MEQVEPKEYALVARREQKYSKRYRSKYNTGECAVYPTSGQMGESIPKDTSQGRPNGTTNALSELNGHNLLPR